ncbi:MAG: RagB/SusD family nutrient uptake outer membrane protein [Candidatus Pseudobacter hemicellulosilyticus]|uniref:RagB/SusD family nutrient uptake outer membrane protein n=1 Tax=Candidatus Pseudobacter hemicellulosilyticus TaxID=3121375 RepID=A0AAJ6BHM2_9BACT|nr:MAG: RagB/SusD family nutrient uptake outer membrane protein [Pseudobacter sp.]
MNRFSFIPLLSTRLLRPVASLLVLGSLLGGCSKFVETDIPGNKLTAKDAFADNATAASVLTRVLADMSASYAISGTSGVSLLSSLMADELTNYDVSNTIAQAHYMNNVSSREALWWDWYYKFIYSCNDALEQLPLSTGVTAPVRDQLMGEAHFIRAFCYFYLVNYWGTVPMATSTDYAANRLLGRAPVASVYAQIETDLEEALKLLGNDYRAADVVTTTEERVRPNRAVAQALLARVYLYQDKWALAEAAATEVLENAAYYLPEPNDAFLKNSPEAIWQLQPVDRNYNTQDGLAFILVWGPEYGSPAAMRQQLLDLFAVDDKRRTDWIGEVTPDMQTFYFPFKYKMGNNEPVPHSELKEYLMVLRLGEQYLIRAEARAEQSKLAGADGAEADLNAVRARAGQGELSAGTREEMLTLIATERQRELFAEWGHRWLDLKRTGTIDAVMTVLATEKGNVWDTRRQLYPIPLTDVQAAPNVGQNPSYN